MGFFGRFSYVDGAWVGDEPTAEPSLVIDIHDSDIATVDYTPATGATGRFYLGVEPRIYFEDDGASAPVDTAAEARGFAEWVRRVQGRDVEPAAVEELMAVDDESDEPEDAFVEETVERLLVLAGLPLPEALTAVGDEVE